MFKKNLKGRFTITLVIVLTLSLIFPASAIDRTSEISNNLETKAITIESLTWTVTPETDPSILAQEFLGSGVTIVGSPSFIGGSNAAGLFTNTDGSVGFEEGIILSSGNVVDVVGPNSATNTTTNNGLPGDSDLDGLIPGYTTYDATIFEFNFELDAHTGISQFEYVFSSEEYNEWVGSNFNDVFGFFLNEENIALLPDGVTQVSINNVNNGANPSYYRDNTGGTYNTEMDGLTVVLTAEVDVVPDSTNHIKLAIADAGDRILDSNVFLKAKSFTVNQPPEVYVDHADVTVNEGQIATNTGTWSDPEGDDVTLSASIGTVTKGPAETWLWSFPTVDGPDDSQTVAITATDEYGVKSVVEFNLIVNNVSPTVGEITVSENLIPVGTEITASAIFNDPGTADTHEALWDWGDVIDPVIPTLSPANGSHVYDTPGVYMITLTVTDKDGGVGVNTYSPIVVYDPEGGFVTGGGWIDSPAGAYVAEPDLEGKASFGFVSKYKKGASVPIGTTEFQFQVANLNFHSTSYNWLVVAGDKAKFKGKGTINGEGDYWFMLTALDKDDDEFRIKIWLEENEGLENIIYDNGWIADKPIPIASGSIIVHKAK